MNTKIRLGWLRGFRWALAACVLLGSALAALAWEDDTGSLSIRLRAGLSAAEQAAVIARHGGTVESAVAPLRIQVVRVRAGDLPAALADYQADPQVESAEEVRSRRAEWLPNDPQIGSQWALERIGWPAVYSTQIPTGTATVALLDTGVDADHPDLAGRLIPGTSFINGTDGRTDPSGHGTRLAGLISAIADNDEGIAGVAYAGVKVMPVTVLDAGGVGADNAIVAGIVWAADHGADVILMGFSGPDPSRHLQDAIDYAWAKGAVLVAATGNGGLDTPTYPAANRGVIGVAATDPDDGLADFSNRGPAVFLAAPGVDLATTEGPDGYTAVSGTSPAAALTAGAAALLKALDPTLTNGVLLGRLARGAAPAADPQDPDYAAKYGYGRLDLGGALADASAADAMEPVEPVGALVAAGEQGTPAADGVSGGASGVGSPAAGGTATSRFTTSETAPPAGVTWVKTSNLGANQMTLTFWSRAPGNGWFTLLVGSDTPCGTVAQIKAGQDSTGVAAFRRGSLRLPANKAVTYTVRNLMQSTAFGVCFTTDNGDIMWLVPPPADLTTTAATALGSAWDTVGSAGFSAGMAEWTSLALAPDGTPHVAYVDRANGDKATVKKFNGTAWVTVGGVGFSAGSVWFTSLAFAPDGTPYVAYWEWNNSNKATVMKFDGTAWVTVGDAGFSAGYAASISPAFAPDGTPYVAYKDGGNADRATVMKFDGIAWVTVGSAGFSAGPVLFTSLAFAPDGTPYVTYVNETNPRKATVMKFDGTAWVTVGGDWFSAGIDTTLAFAQDGTPYVAFVDWGNDYKATVIKFDGTAWVAVGRVGFSAGRADRTSLAFAPDGTPFVALADGTNGGKATVMKFNGTAWVTAGSAGFSAGATDYTSLAFTPDGTPLVAYLDWGNDIKATVMKLTAGAPPRTLGTPGISNLGANQVTLGLTSSSTGTGWFTLLAGSGVACGTGAQVQAGQDSTGVQAFRHGSLPLTADTAGSYTVRNLTESTDYRVCFTADDGTNLEETPATVPLRTTPAAAASETWGLVGSARFYGGDAMFNSLAFAPDGTPYLAFQDETHAYKTTVVKFDGTAWGTVGDAGFSAGGVYETFLAFAPDGTPYVAFVDRGDEHKATVMKFDGTSWVTVGNAGFSAGFAQNPSLAFAPDGTPHVAFVDGIESYKATVMKFDGTSWVTVGNAGFSANGALETSLAFAPDGTPYVAYRDWANSGKATVMKLDGGSWVSAGNAGFSADEAWFPSLAFAPDGTPYVAYADADNDYKATVMRLGGTSWVPAGSAGFSVDRVFEISLSFAPDGTPYVAYVDGDNGLKATVMKFDGTSWVAVGNAGFSAGHAEFTSLAFAPDGTPYVAYLEDLSGAIDIFGNPEPNPIGLTVMKLLPPSVTVLDSAPNPATAGTPVTFTATVSPGTATGTVTFTGGATALGDAPVNAGTATFSTSTLGVGVHGITAIYSGDAGFGASTSAVLTQTIARADQTIAFANPGPRTYGTSPPLTATAGSGLPVTFSSATGAVCAVTSGGTLSLLDLGTCTIDADQAGDGNVNPAPRVSQTFAVTPATLTIVSALVTPKVYDGTTAATITGTLSGLVGTDQITLNGTGTFAGPGAGPGIAVTPTVTLGGAQAARYLLAQPTGLTGTIEARPVTVTADAQSKTAGDADPALTYQVSSGSLVPGDGFSGGLGRAPGEAVGTYAITQGTLKLGANYALSYVGADLTIAMAAVAPTVSILTTGNLGANQVTLTLQSSATGTGYLTLLPGSDAACGSGAQVMAGQDSTGASAFRRGSLKLTADMAGAYTVRNLTEISAYTVCFTADDGITPQGTPVTADFTTTPPLAFRVTWGTVGGAGFAAAGASYTSLAFAPDGTPYVAYVDSGTANHATVMKLAGGSWVTVGAGTGSYATGASYTSLAFAPDGTPYVAYQDESGKATVVKFDGTDWVTVGGAGFSGGGAGFTSLAFGPDGDPYVAYADWGDSGKATVMRFDGSSWVTVGSAGFSAAGAAYTSLAFAPDGTPYVAYADGDNAEKATVMRFDGRSWVTVGSAGFSTGSIDPPGSIALALAPNGTPYVAYADRDKSRKETVMKFDGTAWITVGSAGFSAVAASSASLAFAPDGTPYVAYRDELYPDKATVMRFNGTSWAIAGNAGFSAGTGGSTSLVFAPDGTPYVAFGATVMRLLPAVGTPTDPTVTIHPAGFPGANQLTLGLESSATGTGWFTLLAGRGTPCGTGAQVEAGQDSTGAPALRRGSLKLDTYGRGIYTVRNLTESTDYRVCFTAADGIGLQNTPATADLATAAAAPFSATWGLVGNAGLAAAGSPGPTSLAFDPYGIPYVAYPDEDNSGKATVMKLDGSAWGAVGGAGFSDGGISDIALAFAPDGTLYAAYKDRNNPGTTTVMKLDHPGHWVTVGGAGFSSGWTHFTALAIGLDGTPYVAYADEDYLYPGGVTTYQATVLKLDGTSWVPVGSAGFSAGSVASLALALAPDGTPYVAYEDGDHAGQATVLRFDGTAWVTVGSAGFSAGPASLIFLAFAPDGTPYVTYRERNDDDLTTVTTARVMKISGTAWVTVGSGGFSAGEFSYTSLAFAADGTPYVAYPDRDNSSKATVLKLDGNAWVPVGGLGFAADGPLAIALTVAPDGTPYVAYADAEHNNQAAVMRLLTPSTTRLDSYPNPATAGTSVAFTAMVEPITPSPFLPGPAGAWGTVTFKDGATTLGDAPLQYGQASLRTSTLTVGDHSITAVYNGGSYLGSTSAVLTLTIVKADQTIAFADPGSQVYGSTRTLTATAGSGLAVTFSTPTGAVCTVAADGTLSVRDVGTCTIDADQTGNDSYNPAPRVSRSFLVTPARLTIAAPAVSPKVYDGTTGAVIAGTLAGVVGADQVTLNGTGTFAGVGAGSGIVVAAAATLGGADADKYTLTQPTGLSGTISARPVTVTADAKAKTFGDADPVLTYQVTSGSLN